MHEIMRLCQFVNFLGVSLPSCATSPSFALCAASGSYPCFHHVRAVCLEAGIEAGMLKMSTAKIARAR